MFSKINKYNELYLASILMIFFMDLKINVFKLEFFHYIFKTKINKDFFRIFYKSIQFYIHVSINQ